MTTSPTGSGLSTSATHPEESGDPAAGDDRRSHWRVAQPDPEMVRRLVQSERLPEVLARLVVNRGHEDPKAVQDLLTPSLHFLHDPAGLPEMERAAARVQRAVESGETILIHGDYDVDGVSGTVLLVRLARTLGAKVEWHIPHRTRDGYSFGDHSVAKAEEVGATLVISVDNGTSAVEPVSALAEAGVDVIVTDHHEPPDGELPPTHALVNPKLPGHDYPFRELCGSAVAFKLAWAVCQRISGSDKVRPDLRAYLLEALGYVAVATICDVVPLIGENRVLTHFGLRALRDAPAPGMLALLERTGLAGRDLTPEDVGYQIGPRINASGRMDSAARAVECMLAADAPEGRRCAEALELLNDARREVEREVLKSALGQANEHKDDGILVVGGDGWHPGVVGIVASRLVDRFDKPALVIGIDEHGVGRGSARSVDGVSVLDIMKAGADHMRRFGGHAMAAGCEIEAAALGPLREALVAEAVALGREESARPLDIDARVRLEGLDESLMAQIQRLEPCGERNPKPVLLAEDVRLDDMPRLIGQDRSHLLLKIRSGTAVFKALAFGMGKREPELSMGRPLDIVFTPRISHWRGRSELELVLSDFASR
ncbi:MAG: single-stranded-DNA-specific exonuclease RecJ [Planctomycetota bacterium]|nr:single-stranded-DNA-specific exonuclease RecJ [Planctomycetota bacterium]